MKKCHFCGELNPDTTVVCPWCGRRQQIGDAASDLENKDRARTEPRHDFYQQYFRSSKIKGVGAGLAVVGIAAALAWILFLITGNAIQPDLVPPSATAQPNTVIPSQVLTAAATASPTIHPTSTISKTPSPRPTAATATPTPTTLPQAVILTGVLNVREGPSAAYKVLTWVYAHDALTVLGRDLGQRWVKILLADSTEGWVSAKSEHVALS
jgi:Bacterial SH3 domain